MARKLPIGSKIGKVWGWTKAVFQSDTTEVQHLKVKKGWECSNHEHVFKHNLFYVLHGELRITVEKDNLKDETVLTAGEMTAIKPGDKHKFEALTDCELIELYWVSLDPDDIRRYSQGGETKTRAGSAESNVEAPKLAVRPARKRKPKDSGR